MTPHYLEIEHDIENGFRMGVYLCVGQHVYNCTHNNSIHINHLKTFQAVQDYIETHGKIFLFLGEGTHKIKRKAEQIACNEALNKLSI